MIHNIVIDILQNVLLTITWEGERQHNAYWHIVATHPTTGSVIQRIDGPFPNQFMAAADIFKRFSSLPGFAVLKYDQNGPSLEDAWKERFGTNFKNAFKAAAPFPEAVEGVYHAALIL